MEDAAAEVRRREAEASRREEEKAEALANAAALERANEIARRREEEFVLELERLESRRARRRALREKRADARTVRSILSAAGRRPEPSHYAVLGMGWWIRMVGGGGWYLGPLRIVPGITTRTVRRAYRTRSRQVHPDKNRDGRAEEAFRALEDSLDVLADDGRRRSYDLRVVERRRRRAGQVWGTARDALGMGSGAALGTFRAARRVLGPVATPLFVLGALMV